MNRILRQMLLLTVVAVNANVTLAEPTDRASGLLTRMPSVEAGRLKEIVAGLVRSSIPEHYAGDKDWGQQKRIYAGIKLRREGWRLETKRRWREVNHGVWTRYEVDLIDPSKSLRIDLEDLQLLRDGAAQFRLRVEASLDCFARRSRWNFGVQLWSFSTEARANVALTITGTIRWRLDFANIPPDVVFDPTIDDANVQVAEFEVNKISDVGGDAAEGIGDLLDSVLKREIIQRQNERLADKMNRQIAKNEDRLKISMSEWLRKFVREPESNTD